ncbi:MAG: 3-dehydroquinate synthase [Isosphaeraceae bacterium]|jgi:3-dehydroquinate synthase|nr:MAG: 3-dehydroquinate synthase [Isosphaeraceae bacterium]
MSRSVANAETNNLKFLLKSLHLGGINPQRGACLGERFADEVNQAAWGQTMSELAERSGGRLIVELGLRRYPIVVASEGDSLREFVRERFPAPERTALVVADANVRELGEAVRRELEAAGLRGQVVEVPAGEGSKSLEQASRLWDILAESRADRRTVVVAVGGGVVGDLAGFAAATYARGLALLMVPTTLLAMVDSSVGGKVGINHPRAKNLLGSFHQPAGVWIDPACLRTLPEREFRSGLAEVVKYGVILDPEFFGWLEAHGDRVVEREGEALRTVIARCCALKAGVVAADEREETGLRAILNFGHTIGHAIESVMGYERGMLHGEAVSIGMVRECRLAERIGWVDGGVTARLEALLKRLGLPTAMPDLPRDGLWAAMGRDKKNVAGVVRFVLPRALGRMEATGNVPAALLESMLEPGP